MKLFFAFLVVCFVAGLATSPSQSEGRMRWYLAGLCLALVAVMFVFREL